MGMKTIWFTILIPNIPGKKEITQQKGVMRYDKLYIDKEAFIFDEVEGKVVRALSPGIRSDSMQISTATLLSRAESSARRAVSTPQLMLTRAEYLHSVG